MTSSVRSLKSEMMSVRILQFGEGNFLRGYFDWMIQRINDRLAWGGMVQIIQPRGEKPNPVSAALTAAGGRFAVCLRGLAEGRPVERVEEIRCVTGVDVAANLERFAVEGDLRFVVSNTTEAGIQYVKGADTFPAKVLRLLKARFAANLPGLVFLPCELIEANGAALKACVLRHLADEATPDAGLRAYIETACVFCDTLVDRIVSGKPDAETAQRFGGPLGLPDTNLVCAEPFHFLAVQPPAGYDLEAELPLKAAGLNVVYTTDLAPYRVRKIRFLNAVHTTMVWWALERGFEEVAQVLADPVGAAFVKRVLFDEVFPTVTLPDAEKTTYAAAVLERFANPFAHHKLRSIALNSLAKWQVRCLPVVCDYRQKFGVWPTQMMAGYEALARHYDHLSA